MKKKSGVIGWSIFTIALLALLVVALLTPNIFTSCGKISINIAPYFYKDAQKYSVGNGQCKDVNSFEIDWITGSVEVVGYEGSDIIFEEKCDGEITEDYKLRYLVEKNKLKIKFCASGSRIFNYSPKQLTIKVPNNYQFKKVVFDLVSADLKINEFASEEVDIDTVSGHVDLSNVSGSKLEVESVSGTQKYQNIQFTEIDFDSVSGEISVSLTNQSKTNVVDVESVSGKIVLYLPKQMGFEATFTSVSGDLYCDFEGITLNGKNKINFGDKNCKINGSTTSGDLTIKGI